MTFTDILMPITLTEIITHPSLIQLYLNFSFPVSHNHQNYHLFPNNSIVFPYFPKFSLPIAKIFKQCDLKWFSIRRINLIFPKRRILLRFLLFVVSIVLLVTMWSFLHWKNQTLFKNSNQVEYSIYGIQTNMKCTGAETKSTG